VTGPFVPREHPPFLEPHPLPVHLVQFYDPDRFPAKNVAEFLYAGLEAEESSLLITTPDHTHQVKDCLEHCGLDTQQLQRDGLLTCLDASFTLNALRTNHLFDEQHIETLLGQPLAQSERVSPSGCVRVFGELGNMILNDGDYDGYGHLVNEWKRLAAGLTVRTYCGYSVEGHETELASGGVYEMCDLQDEAIPAISALGPKGWLVLMQEKSHSLHIEIQRREAIESALRGREQEFAGWMDAQMVHWLESRGPALPPATLLGRPRSANVCENVVRAVEEALQEILEACEMACSDRKTAAPGSEEWQKSTGKILAYGKLTQVLYKLQGCVSGKDRQ
jgi:hypothetical protein